MSKETSNTAKDLMSMPHHITMALFNELQKIFKEEAEAQKKAEKEARSNYSAPTMPSLPSIPHY